MTRIGWLLIFFALAACSQRDWHDMGTYHDCARQAQNHPNADARISECQGSRSDYDAYQRERDKL